MKKALVDFFLLVIFSSYIFGCASQPRLRSYFNLNSDPKFYKFAEYASPHQFEHALFISIVDKRPDNEKVFDKEIQWFYDEIWTEPPSKMMEKLFLKELRTTRMFRSVDLIAKGQSLSLEIELNSLVGHYDGKTRMATGRLKIHSTLKTASDKRIILDKDYENKSNYKVHLHGKGYNHIYYHIGKATNAVVEQMMMDLEQTLFNEIRK